MKKDIRLIALDLDGTLLDSGKNVTARTRAVLDECARRGIIVMPATGRPATGFPKVMEAVPGFRYALTSNGALVYDYTDKKAIYEDLLSVENALKLYAFSRNYDLMCDVYVDGNGYSETCKLESIRRYFASESMIEYVLSTRISVDSMETFLRRPGLRGVEKMVLFFGDLSLQAMLLQDLRRFDFIRTTTALVNNVEINNHSANKGDSLLRFGAQLGLTRDQIMACGDGLNDLDMIRAAGFGVAMANAVPEIRDAADHITLSNNEDGVAAVIEEFVL